MSSSLPVNPSPTPSPVRTGLSPIAWILIILGGLFTAFIVVLIAGGLFVAHKIKQAGFDPALMRKNPALAISKIVTSANPNAEVLNVDEGRGVIRIRDKQSGKTFTMNFEDVKRGKMVFQEDGKDAVTITASGDGKNGNVVIRSNGKDALTISGTADDKTGTVNLKTSDGLATFGAGAAKAPAWMPVYPGSHPEGLVGADNAEGTSGSYHFATKDSPEKVAAYYKEQLRSAGLKVSSSTTNDADGKLSGGLTAEDPGNKRKVLIGYSSENGETNVTAAFTQKK